MVYELVQAYEQHLRLKVTGQEVGKYMFSPHQELDKKLATTYY